MVAAAVWLVISMWTSEGIGVQSISPGDQVTLENGWNVEIGDGWKGERVRYSPDSVPPNEPIDALVLSRTGGATGEESIGIRIWSAASREFSSGLERETSGGPFEIVKVSRSDDSTTTVTVIQDGPRLTIRAFVVNPGEYSVDAMYIGADNGAKSDQEVLALWRRTVKSLALENQLAVR